MARSSHTTHLSTRPPQDPAVALPGGESEEACEGLLRRRRNFCILDFLQSFPGSLLGLETLGLGLRCTLTSLTSRNLGVENALLGFPCTLHRHGTLFLSRCELSLSGTQEL